MPALGPFLQWALAIGGSLLVNKIWEYFDPMSSGEKDLLLKKTELSKEAESRQADAMKQLMREDATAKYKNALMGIRAGAIEGVAAAKDKAAMLNLQGDLGMADAEGRLSGIGQTSLSQADLAQVMEQPVTLKSLLGL